MTLPFLPLPLLPPPLAGMPAGVPVGTVVAFAGEVTRQWKPLEAEGWMVCDGRPLNTHQHSELFQVIGYQYTPQSGGATFAIPDLRGYFLRGVDPRESDSSNDPDSGSRALPSGTKGPAVGSRQDCAFQLHEHKYSQAGAASAPSQSGQAAVTTTQVADTSKVVEEPGGKPLFTSASETRPKNVSVYFIIKFTSVVCPAPLSLAPGLGG